MNRFRVVGLSVVLTSAFWLALAAWWSMRPASDERPATGVEGAVGKAGPSSDAISDVPVIPDQAAPAGSVDSLLLIPVAGARADDLVDSFTRSGGIEIPAPQGMPVIAAAPGIVEKLSAAGDGGKSIYVRSPDRTRLYHYAPLGAYAPGLSEGQVIGAGDQLGSLGGTGKVPHLRFEVLAIMPDRDWSGDKRPLNPFPLLGGRGNRSR